MHGPNELVTSSGRPVPLLWHFSRRRELHSLLNDQGDPMNWTTVLATLRKRGRNGHLLLSVRSMLQMAGRAGRRGIEEQGHTVVEQTPFEGAEDCCKLLFAGSDPLVSQFTATYGITLNLLAVSGDLAKAERVLLDQRIEASKLRKKVKATQGYRISTHISQMQHSGWKEFLQGAGALKPESNELIMPLGDAAASVRGVKELWLVIVFTRDILEALVLAQLAAACAFLVSDGIK